MKAAGMKGLSAVSSRPIRQGADGRFGSWIGRGELQLVFLLPVLGQPALEAGANRMLSASIQTEAASLEFGEIDA